MSDIETEPPAAPTADPSDIHPVGAAVIEGYLRTLPISAGVYRMVDRAGSVLYVGKARNLKKRVANYTQPARLSLRIRRMVAQTASMEFTTTHTEAEALLLESNLIKRLKPRYNILLRDDKSFPSILLTGDHDFPQVVKHRGAQNRRGDYHGPFASAWAVNRAVTAVQRAFLLRSCTDTVFAQRTRPCLLFQIKRCSAPCVGRISREDYGELVQEAKAFFRGDSARIQEGLIQRMQACSEALDFETAARYRDRLRALATVLAHQDINVTGVGDADVIAAYQQGGRTCVQLFFFRSGCNYGNRAYFPDHGAADDAAAVIEAFIGQFYAAMLPPQLILVSEPLPNRLLLMEALAVRAGRRVEIAVPQRGDKRTVIESALANAREALGRHIAENATQRRLLDDLAGRFGIEPPIERIEVYDNSHVQGAQAIGAMIVAGADGFDKRAYRKFTIRGIDKEIAAGDDFAMMRQVLSRRFTRALAEDPDRSRGPWPDLLLIDGGLGQLNVARQVLAELGLDDIAVAGIAKGPDRNAGRERLFLPDREPLSLDPRDPVLYFLQRLRDEAHRFAIGTHRAKRSAAIRRSTLDDIPGIGPNRKRALLHHFGSAAGVEQAGLADLEAVPGISGAIARKIYDWFRPGG